MRALSGTDLGAASALSTRSVEWMRDYVDLPVSKLGLSIRPRNALKEAQIETVGQLIQKKESELLRIKNFGRKSLREIREILGSMGLFLRMQPTENLPKENQSVQPSRAVDLPVSKLGLSIRPRNALKEAQIETVGQLIQKKESELLRIKNFGWKSLREINGILGSMGLFLGMQPTENLPKENQSVQPSRAVDLPVSKLGLSIRPRNALKEAQIETVGQLIQKKESELLRIKNFGWKSLREINGILGSMGLFLGMQPTENLPKENQSVQPSRADDLMGMSVKNLYLSVRTNNCFRRAGIRTVDQLVRMTDSRLLSLPNFGRRCFSEVKEALQKHDFHLALVEPRDEDHPSDNELGPAELTRTMNFIVNFVTSRRDEIASIKIFSQPWPISISTHDLPLRARTRNCLARARRLYTGTRWFSTTTYGELLEIPGMGVLSVLDFACVAEAAIRHEIDAERELHGSETNQALAEAYKKLETVLDADWSIEVSGVDGRFKDILHSWDGTVFEQIDRITGEHDQRVSQVLRLAEAVAELHARVDEIAGKLIEEALEEFLVKTAQIDKTRIRAFMRRFGFSGDRPSTLQETGVILGITRERVRQLESNITKRFPPHPIFMPQLDLALELVKGIAPVALAEAADLIQRQGLSSRPFDPRSLLSAAELCNREPPIRVERVKGQLFVVANDQHHPRDVVSIALRQAGASGIANVGEVFAQAVSRNLDYDENNIRRILEDLPGIEFLNEDWYWHRGSKPNRNRLRNVARKMLSVVDPIDVNQLREGVRRIYRYRNSSGTFGAWPLIVPPRAAMLSFFRVHPEFSIAENSQVHSAVDLDFREELGETETVLVEILRSSPTCLLDRASLRDACIKRGMNMATMNTFLTHSPIIAHPGTDIWSLRGVRVDPAAVNALREANAERPRQRRVLDHGWTDEGHLWIAVRLPKDLSSLVFAIPQPVLRFLEGREFRARDPEGADFGQIRLANATSYGYGSFLRRRGADADDILIGEFDLVSGRVLLRLEDDDFLEELSPSA